MTTLVKDLLDLPEHVRKGDFVVKLGEGISHPKDTAETFVVTPALADAFDRALRLVGSALRDGRSQASYLHGSFGSGKSHFMALLSLLLAGNEEAWRKPELHPLRAKHAFVGKSKLLELHFHMIGKESIESAVFDAYLAYVKAHHPDATLPGLFADEEFFADARRLMEKLGEDAFFAEMGAAKPKKAGWGTVRAETGWDRARFEAAAASTEVTEREKLFSALVKAWYKAYGESGRYVDIDQGLAVMARHAKSLGYDGVVLFLDELILWFAHRAAEHAWLHNEVQKMVKLVEAQESHRDLPIVSFIARQRNLAEMVGEEFAGAESVRLYESLKHWEGRFDTLVLEDRNLPAIVEKRVLRPKSDDAKRALDRAFAELRRKLGPSWDVLLGAYDAEAFRKLYPFSPALVDALVALSNSLQRERTAIKLLVELLVEHTDDLAVGDVMPVGDLFDVLAGGEDAADGVMRARFDAAKKLYEYELLPRIHAARGTESPERCQRMRDGHPVRLGCSNCKERGCRADNRIVKTLLIASLVPEVRVFKDLKASTLVQLNHGSLRSPIPGGEVGIALSKLRELASHLGQIRVGDTNDPQVSVRLEGVPLGPILEQARDKDTPGMRQRLLRELLFSQMGLDLVADSNKEHEIKWRGTKRRGRVRFGNVRKMGPEQLACAPEHDFQVVVDYPFDETGFGPRDDEKVLEDFEEQGAGTWTLAWLPSFFSKTVNDLLGDLVVLTHILESKDSRHRYLSHLNLEDRSRAELDLTNLEAQKRQRLMQAIDQAYGIRDDRAADIDPSLAIDEHLRLLKPGAKLVARQPAGLPEALTAYIEGLLEARYPRHPRFGAPLTTARVNDLVEVFGQLVDADDKRIAADRGRVEEVRGTLGELGLARTTENAVLLVEDRTLQLLEQARNKASAERPTVGQMRGFIDPSGSMGLETGAEDLVLRCYARGSARAFVLHGRPYEPDPRKPIPDEVELEKPDLPALQVWHRALGLGGMVFGVSLGSKALHADNLKRFEQRVREELAKGEAPARQIPGALEQRLSERELAHDADRLATARSAAALAALLARASGRGLVEGLAEFEPLTSGRALAAHLVGARGMLETLQNDLVFGPFELLAQRPDVVGGAELLERVGSVLRQDELNAHLAAELSKLAMEAQRILTPPASPPARPGTDEVVRSAALDARGEAAVRELDRVLAELRALLASHGEGARLVGKLEVLVPKKR